MLKPRLSSVSQAVRPRELNTTWERVALLALLLLAGMLAFVNLPTAPRIWFDEGSHLQVPKTLVRYGVYADISSEGFRYFGPTVGVGPTVMLPLAAVFTLVDVGLLQARLVISAYLLLALAGFYFLARRLYGSRMALLALALLLASRTLNFDGIIEYGRQVLGEVPGVAFLLLGVLAWIKALDAEQKPALERARPWYQTPLLLTVLSGLGFGLALVTKNQFVLIVPPTLALIALLDWRYFRAASWWLRLLPLLLACACFATWILVQLLFLGPGNFATNLAQTRQAAGGAIFVFDGEASLRAIRYLVQVYGGLLLPALLYGLWRCRVRTPQALAELLIMLMATLWLLWYVTSLGWPRYAFPAVVLGALAVARLVVDLYIWVRAQTRLPIPAWLFASYTVLVIAVPLTLTMRVVFSPDDSPQRFAAYLNANVPQDVIVETWEPELGFLTNHRYHFPPIKLLDTAVRQTWLDGAPLTYDPFNQNPAYIIIGPFGEYTRIYTPDERYQLETQIGPYRLYRIGADAARP